MPYVKQICHHDVSPKQAEEAWWDFTHHASREFDLPTTALYGGPTEFTTDSRTRGRDIIFVVELDESPERIKFADANAKKLALFVSTDQYERGYGDIKIGVLLHHGQCGWGEKG